MELFTLDSNFNALELVEGYESLVWTERFIEAGDTQIVVPASMEMYDKLSPGTLVGLSKSRELMLLDTRDIQDGMMTVSGKTVEAFFDERNLQDARWRLKDTTDETDYPGRILGALVNRVLTEHTNLKNQFNRIRVGTLDESGNIVTESIPTGPAYKTMLDIAQKYNIGMAMYWTAAADGNGHELVFTTRTGDDLTSAQNAHNFVLFSPQLDNLANIKELTSDVGYKEAVVVRRPLDLVTQLPSVLIQDKLFERQSRLDYAVRRHQFDAFRSRMGEILCDDVTMDQLGTGTDEEKRDKLYAIMRQRGHAYLNAHRRKALVDGELPPAASTQYKYYLEANPDDDVEYRLGDLVEVGGDYSYPVPGVVTEYIHSIDSSGERSYPTIGPKPDPIAESTGVPLDY